MSQREKIIADILGSKAKIKILALLCRNPYHEYKMGDIVEKTGLTYRTVSHAIHMLKKHGIIKINRYGPAKLISINTQSPLAIKIIKLFEGR